MSRDGVDVCGNCGAPLERDEGDRCRWCHAGARPRTPRARRDTAGERLRANRKPNWRVAAGAVIVVFVAVVAGLVIAGTVVSSEQSGPPRATGPARPGTGQGVPPGSTDLQNLQQDFGPWRQLVGQETGTPALLLLLNGTVQASTRWTISSAASTGWTQDLGGNVNSVTLSGGRAAITDADDVHYTVGVGQAFVVASNPGTALLIKPGGTVMSMTLAQATAMRQPLRK
ncbi:MAG: hypothetical protein FWE35_21305 [Streptosporangiales bacterium]|nr:hypothetical protein [Streptosporangiales bacterium]